VFPSLSKLLSRGSRSTRGNIALGRRSFAAAQTSRLLADWRVDFGFTPSEISNYLEIVRGRSRQMAKDSPHLKRWLQLCETNLVGNGFALKSTPYDIDRTGELRIDTAAARIIERGWWKFCNGRDENGLTYFDITGRKTEPEVDRLCVRYLFRDGEFFLRIRQTARNPYGIAFEVLRPDWCDHKHNVGDTGKGTLIHCGVEMDINTRAPVGYWFRTTPTNAWDYSVRGTPVMRVPANEIIHCFIQEDEHQPRGMPIGHASLVKLKMLDELDVAELVAAKEESCSTATYYAPKGDENIIADLTSTENADVANALIAEKEPGQQEVLPIGWKRETHTPVHPNREHAPFKSSMLKDVASGFGVEYANFANDWSGVSYSSVRLGTIAERDMWQVYQQAIIAQCKTPQFLAFLQSFLTHAVSGNLPASKLPKFAEHEFRGRRWMWVDPMRDMAANKIAVEMGWKTNSQITADMGGDWDDNQSEIMREQATKTLPVAEPTEAGDK
jgi:lambda family phage portal protein